MHLKSWNTISFPLLLLSVFSLSNNACAGQAASQTLGAAPEDLRSVAHASCGFQATEVPVHAVPGSPSVIATVKCDQELTIIYDEVGFYKVQISKKAQGYIAKGSVIFVTNSNQTDPPHDGGNEGVVRAGTKGIAPPSCASCPEPKYTPEARGAKYQGTIILEAVISAGGTATYARAKQVQTLDRHIVTPPALDRAWVSLEETAIDTIKQWRFKPAHGADGKPVTVLVPVEVTFRLLN